ADRLEPGPTPAPRPGAAIERRWYINSVGQTMVLVDGPAVFDMGSPLTEADRTEVDVPHRRLLPRRDADPSHEVSRQQVASFAREKGVATLKLPRKLLPEPTGPQTGVTYFQAAEFCNWLSDREGLRRCYVPNAGSQHDQGHLGAGMLVDEEAVEQGGYRLPTE